MSLLLDTQQLIESQAACHDAVIVALDGKDSMVVMDLLAKTFKRVEAFCMVYAFGMDRFRRKAEYVKARWGVELKEVEHYGAIDHFNRGWYCLPRVAEGPRKLRDAYEQQKREYGIPLVATGSRMSESLGRRQCIQRDTWPGWHPIALWRKADVVGYLRAKDIPLPDKDADMQGISVDRETILNLYDHSLGDYELIRKRFPFVECMVKQRGWYGQESFPKTDGHRLQDSGVVAVVEAESAREQ